MIDFLLNNIPLVIVILGGIFSLLGRQEDKKKKTVNKPVQTARPKDDEEHDYQTSQTELPKNENPFELLKRELEKQLKTEVEKHKPELNKSKEVIAQQETQNANIEEKQELIPSRHQLLTREMKKLEQELANKKASSTKVLPKLTSEKVVEGIIWSEVLGPPRAKKPYR